MSMYFSGGNDGDQMYFPPDPKPYGDQLYDIVRKDLSNTQGAVSFAGTWEGVPIEKFTKEELIEIVKRMGRMMMDDQNQRIRDSNFLDGLK